jgi:hypothetical protein
LTLHLVAASAAVVVSPVGGAGGCDNLTVAEVPLPASLTFRLERQVLSAR